MDISKQIEFCEDYCGKLTNIQIELIKKYIEENKFVGVGHDIGTLDFHPTYEERNIKKIILPDGHNKPASIHGIIKYNEE